MEFRASSYRSGFIGLAIVGGLAAGVIGLGGLLVSTGGASLNRPPSPRASILGVALVLDLVLLILTLYWSIAALRLSYSLSRNGLMIRWGASRLIVPVESIQAVMLGSEVGAAGEGVSGLRAFRGVGWAGLRAGRARLANNKPARVFTTTSLYRSIVVLTPDCAYVVSPRDPEAFAEAWRVRLPLGPTHHWREEEQRAWLLDLPLWRDRLAWALVGLGLFANLTLHGYLTFVFERLPSMLSFHFDLLGQADRIGGRAEILRLPQVALILLALDLGLGFAVYGRQHIAAYMVWGGGLVLQLLVWGAVITIIG